MLERKLIDQEILAEPEAFDFAPILLGKNSKETIQLSIQYLTSDLSGEFKKYLQKNRQLTLQLLANNKARKILREKAAILQLLNLSSEEKLDWLRDPNKLQLLLPIEWVTLIFHVKRFLSPVFFHHPNVRHLILECMHSERAKSFLRIHLGNLNSLLNPLKDPQVDIELLCSTNENSNENNYKFPLTDTERQKILEHLLANHYFGLAMLCSKQALKLKKTEILFILNHYAQDAMFFDKLKKSKTFNEVILPNLLTSPEIAARLLSSFLAEDNLEFFSIDAFTKIIKQSSKDKIFIDNLSLSFLKQRILIKLIEAEDTKLYFDLLFKACLDDFSLTKIALNQYLKQDASFTPEQILILLSWHTGENLLNQIDRFAITTWIETLIKSDFADKQVVLAQISRDPYLFSRLSAETKFKINLSLYKDQPLTYAKLQLVLQMWRAKHHSITTFFKMGRWFNSEGMPETMREIKKIISHLPKNAKPDDEVNADIRSALETILYARQRRSSSSTLNPESHTSKIMAALKTSSTLKIPETTVSETPVEMSTEDILKNFKEIQNSFEIYKNRLVWTLDSAEKVMTTMQFLINNFIGTSSELHRFYLSNPREERLWSPVKLKINDRCYIHLEVYATWEAAVSHFKIFINQFINAFGLFSKVKKVEDFFQSFGMNFVACVEGKTETALCKAAGFAAELSSPTLDDFMSQVILQAEAYLRATGESIILKNMVNFIMHHFPEQIFVFDHETELKNAKNIKEDIKKEDVIPPGCKEKRNPPAYSLSKEIIFWYLRKLEMYPEKIESPSHPMRLI